MYPRLCDFSILTFRALSRTPSNVCVWSGRVVVMVWVLCAVCVVFMVCGALLLLVYRLGETDRFWFLNHMFPHVAAADSGRCCRSSCGSNTRRLVNTQFGRALQRCKITGNCGCFATKVPKPLRRDSLPTTPFSSRHANARHVSGFMDFVMSVVREMNKDAVLPRYQLRKTLRI